MVCGAPESARVDLRFRYASETLDRMLTMRRVRRANVVAARPGLVSRAEPLARSLVGGRFVVLRAGDHGHTLLHVAQPSEVRLREVLGQRPLGETEFAI